MGIDAVTCYDIIGLGIEFEAKVWAASRCNTDVRCVVSELGVRQRR